MDLSIDPKARNHFDQTALRLKSQCSMAEPPQQVRRSWQPNIHVVNLSPEDVIGPVTISASGQRIAQADRFGHAERALTGTAASDFERLCVSVQKAIRPNGVVAIESVRNAAIQWLFDANSATSFCEHTISSISTTVQKYVVSVPISGLHIQAPLEVGPVVFRELSSEQIDKWFRGPAYERLSSEDQKHIDNARGTFSKLHRGFAIAQTTTSSDQRTATTKGLDAVEETVSILRFFSPQVLSSRHRSLCVPHGQDRANEFIVVLDSEGGFAGHSRGLRDPESAAPWTITDREARRIKDAGLDAINRLIANRSQSDFAEKVLASVCQFSDAAVETRTAMRLVLALSALECIYLGNSNEPIQQNLGERLALVAERDVDKRIETTKIVRKVYDIRSKFVHHGESVDHAETLDRFLSIAWTGIRTAVLNGLRFATVPEFTVSIDRSKFR